MTKEGISAPSPNGRGNHPNSRKNLRPPWQKGMSGKPGGNPYPITRHLKDIIREINPNGTMKGREVAEIIVRTASLPSSRGYATALTQLLDRTEGKVPGDGVQVNFNEIKVLIVREEARALPAVQMLEEGKDATE